jgi:hypothetical protein
MPIHTDMNPEKQLTIHTVKGEVTFEEAMATLKAFYSGNPTLNVIMGSSRGNNARALIRSGSNVHGGKGHL